MSRKKKHEEHVNHEKWAIPYADLMTLLLAFFVVMYAMSAVNTGKYKALSDSIIEAFNGSVKVVRAPDQDKNATSEPSGVVAVDHLQSTMKQFAKVQNEQQNLELIREQVQRALQPLIEKKLVNVRESQTWLEIEIRTDILFPSGVAQLSKPADDVLGQIADILMPFTNPVRIEGYTDDRPISNMFFPSNWELSAARAASVARLFSDKGIIADRLGIIGWGETRPSASNDTEEGRNHNRRVLVVVLGNQPAPGRIEANPEEALRVAERGRPELPVVPTIRPLPEAEASTVSPGREPMQEVHVVAHRQQDTQGAAPAVDVEGHNPQAVMATGAGANHSGAPR